MTLRNISLNLELGQEILVGKNDDRATITKIEWHEKSGEVTLNTTRGPRKALTFRVPTTQDSKKDNPADKYRQIATPTAGPVLNTYMRVDEVLTSEEDIEEWKASRELCKSSKPNSKLGASALASCKSQGFRTRTGKKSHKIGKKRVTVGGKKIRGKKYGGPLPDWS